MESTSNKIIIIFEPNTLVTSEEIKSSLVLQRRYSDIFVIDEIAKNSELLKPYKYLLDCTQNNKLFHKYLSNKKGILIKEKYEYIKTATNKIIMPGPNISQLTITKYSTNKEIKDLYEKNKEEYYDKILFLTYKEPEYKNKIEFENSIKEGLDFTDFVTKSKNQKRYKLINQIPENKEENTIYVTPENIEILHKLIEVSKNILF